METAIENARRGHEVILCEKSDRLGCVMLCEEKVPFKQKLAKYLSAQADIVNELGIDVRLNTLVTPEYAKAQNADVVIAALGSRPIIPAIPGIDGKNVVQAESAYYDADKLGESVVILGGGLVGVELVVWLGMLGIKVTLVEMTDRLNDGGNFLHMRGVHFQILKYGLDVRLSTKAVEIRDDGVRCETADGETFIAADTVISAVGVSSLHAEAAALYDSAPDFHIIGDCLAARNIMEATKSAFTVARDVGKN
jgi:pyruvate/2-oxoglutarate dehydrogenase complex dihydrolipoamide dehydrogenase (E3) component